MFSYINKIFSGSNTVSEKKLINFLIFQKGGEKNMQKINILNSTDGVKSAYRLTLEADKLDIVCLTANYEKITGDFFEKEYALKLYGRVATREILPDTLENRQYAKSKDAAKNQVRFLALQQTVDSDCMLAGDKIILVSYRENNPYALVVEDRDLAANLQLQFNRLWESLK